MKSDHVRFSLCSAVCCLFYFLLTLPLSVHPVIAPRHPRTNPAPHSSRFYPKCQIPSFPWVYHQRELPSLLFLSLKIHLVNVGNWRAFGNYNHWNRYNSVEILDWGGIRHVSVCPENAKSTSVDFQYKYENKFPVQMRKKKHAICVNSVNARVITPDLHGKWL